MEFPDRKYLQGNAAEPQQESIFSGLPEEIMLKLFSTENCYDTRNFPQHSKVLAFR